MLNIDLFVKFFSLESQMPNQSRTFAYLRVSTADQRNDKFQTAILKFANDRNFGQVEFVEEVVSGKVFWRKRKIGSLIDKMNKGDILLVPELSRLGRSTLEVLDILKTAKDKDIAVYDAKGNLELNGDNIQSKVMSTMFALFAELERDFISQRTKEALAARKKAGVKLGRPKGPGRSKLDPFREEIIALLKTGVPKTRVAGKFGVKVSTLYNWLKQNRINVKPVL
jgi:DNA invertase Pin-like site-specific DNA recombinase